MRVETLVTHGEAMHQELGLEHYLTGAGLKAEPEFQAVYDRHGELLGDEALAAARASGSREIFEWITDVRVGRAVAPYEERQLVWEQGAELVIGSQRIPFLRAPIELANSPDRDFRIGVDRARARLGAEGLNAMRRDRFMLERELVESLGLGGYVEALAMLSGINLDALGLAAASFLDRTRGIYEDALGRLVRLRIGVTITELVRSDAGWMFRADRFDHAFPPARLLETASGQMREMGLDYTVGGRVRFDTEERAGKQPRAFCVPVRVPDEVYLVIRPRGGHGDYRTFWHELGHAMHFASADPDLPFAARWLGDNSVTEGFAMLWDHLPVDPGWVRRYTGLSASDVRDLTYELAVGELFLARRYAAKLLYELELHRSDVSSMAERYTELLSEATRFRYLEDDYLMDVDAGFYAARYLRAWQLEASMAGRFVELYDEDWYRNPHAGVAVQELMCRGQSDPADHLARQVTGKPLAFDAVIGRMERALA